MSYDYQTNYTGSPLNSNTVYNEVGTATPVNSNTVSYAYVATISPATNNLVYSSVNTLSPVNVYNRLAVVSPVISNTTYSHIGTSSPVNNVNTLSPVNIYTRVAVVSPIISNTSYSRIGTNSPVNVSTLSPVNVYDRVAVASPIISNIAYSRIGTSLPVNSNIYSSTQYKPLQDSTFTERSTEGKHSMHNKDNCGLSKSKSSFVSSNGSLNDSDIDKYSLVGYNTSPTTKPCGRNNKEGWYEMHEKHVAMASRIRATVVLCGDSIIAGLTRYSGVWNKYFKPLNAINCGIGGDQTQHVLWRMENMKLPYTVKYIVVHCGTNNIDRDSTQDIANGVISCGLVLQENNPELRVVITGLLPRDRENTHRRYKIVQINKFLKQYCRQFSNFTYMKQDNDWILNGGLLNEQLYYTDHLHLVESGNHKFAASIINILDKLSKNEEIIYSSDENENDNENNCKFKRIHGETRLDTPRRESSFYESPFKLVRKSNAVTQKRKRSLSPVAPVDRSSTSQKRRRKENFLNSEKYLKGDDSNSELFSTPKIQTTNRNWSKVVKKEYHGEFALTKELKHDQPENTEITPEKVIDEHLEGTVKSIDISLADSERRKARKAKFADLSAGVGSSLKQISDSSKADIRCRLPDTSAPSALVLKRKRSTDQRREENSKKKL